MTVKKGLSKSSYAAKNAPPFCHIWFVNNSQLLYTREPAEDYDSLPPLIPQASNALRSQSLGYPNTQRELQQIYSRSSSSINFIGGSTSMTRSTKQFHGDGLHNNLQSNTSSDSGYSSSTEVDSRLEEESLSKQLEEVNIEAEESRNQAFQELLKRKRLEALAIEANNKVEFHFYKLTSKVKRTTFQLQM